VNITCNNCLDEFEIEPVDIETVTLADLEIQFFPCPSCGRKYVILAADAEMKRMIAERGELQRKIRRARMGKFREKTIRQMIGQLNKIISAQKKLMAELKPRAEQLLKEADHGEV